MKISDELGSARRVFLDTAPVVYLVEKNPHYFPIMRIVGDLYEARVFVPITSPITLAESLVIPVKLGDLALQKRFVDIIARGKYDICED